MELSSMTEAHHETVGARLVALPSRTVAEAADKAGLLTWMLVGEEDHGCKWNTGDVEEAILRGLLVDLRLVAAG